MKEELGEPGASSKSREGDVGALKVSCDYAKGWFGEPRTSSDKAKESDEAVVAHEHGLDWSSWG